jgi:hypothetical protein
VLSDFALALKALAEQPFLKRRTSSPIPSMVLTKPPHVAKLA